MLTITISTTNKQKAQLYSTLHLCAPSTVTIESDHNSTHSLPFYIQLYINKHRSNIQAAFTMFSLNFLSFFTVSLAASTLASPASRRQAAAATTADVTITLIDATQHQWPITVPSTQTWTPTGVAESISHVHIENTGYVPCAFFGVDGAVIVSFPGDVKDLDVGPPQTIVGGICGPFGSE